MIERSVSLYRDSLFVVVHPWSVGQAEDDGVRIFRQSGALQSLPLNQSELSILTEFDQ